jgi:hypothetical protein
VICRLREKLLLGISVLLRSDMDRTLSAIELQEVVGSVSVRGSDGVDTAGEFSCLVSRYRNPGIGEEVGSRRVHIRFICVEKVHCAPVVLVAVPSDDTPEHRAP